LCFREQSGVLDERRRLPRDAARDGERTLAEARFGLEAEQQPSDRSAVCRERERGEREQLGAIEHAGARRSRAVRRATTTIAFPSRRSRWMAAG
jgi:hypothetical protein